MIERRVKLDDHGKPKQSSFRMTQIAHSSKSSPALGRGGLVRAAVVDGLLLIDVLVSVVLIFTTTG